MTFFNPSKLLVAMSTITVLAAAPTAFADAPRSTVPAQLSGQSDFIKLADAGEKTKGNRDRGDRSRDRGNRNRDRGDRHRSNSHSDHGSRNRNRGSRNRDRGYSHNRYYNNRRGWNNSRNYTRHYTTPVRYTNTRRNRRHYTPYRSNIGISFNIGTPRYTQHRWAPTAYSFYQPSYGSYNTYQTQTTCRRVTREAWHHGHRELISVKECSNPWSGTYTVQGSERVIDCRY